MLLIQSMELEKKCNYEISKLNQHGGSKFFKMYQNFVTMLSFFVFFYLVLFYHVKTHLWMIMMKSIILMV